ncbi:MAG: SRPBCC domain-containing protein [Anaerolineales bacterium]|nr:SRPBCC domain-containing protein [Anaerolineales bacterium]
MQEAIRLQIDVKASPEQVWDAWATEQGARSFFAPECKVVAQPGGAYEMYFNMDVAPGLRGGEGMVFLALERPSILSFTWNAPPELMEVREQRTHVTVRLAALEDGRTRVYFCEDGFGVGEHWQKRIEYFRHAWGKVVLPRLAYRFDVGPLDWENMPDVSSYINQVAEY